jgi:hypothetical protein
VYNYTAYQAISLCKISGDTYIKIKDVILVRIGQVGDQEYKIGGPGVQIQFDETAICNGLIIGNPSSEDESNTDIQWIVGGIVEGSCREFFVKLVPKLRHKTLLDSFRRGVIPGSKYTTDGYPSYPAAVSNFGSVHEVVNHSVGFVNEDGTNTNQIENLWSHLNKNMVRDQMLIMIG